MDFALIKEHPYTTGGLILGGGLILFLVLRRPAAPSTAAPAYAASGGTDPNAAAVAVQQGQMQAYVTGLQLQGATQVSLAQIGADVSRLGIAASADVTNTQTGAQLALGINTQNAVVEQTRINAAIQGKYIDAIIAAFTGNRSPSVSATPVSVATPGSPNPTVQNLPNSPVTYFPTGGTGGAMPIGVGSYNPHTIVPGANPVQYDGTELISRPNYATCDPRDVRCVMGNQDLSIAWENDSIHANAVNNRNQCLANAELSRGFGNYSALVSACG